MPGCPTRCQFCFPLSGARPAHLRSSYCEHVVAIHHEREQARNEVERRRVDDAHHRTDDATQEQLRLPFRLGSRPSPRKRRGDLEVYRTIEQRRVSDDVERLEGRDEKREDLKALILGEEPDRPREELLALSRRKQANERMRNAVRFEGETVSAPKGADV